MIDYAQLERLTELVAVYAQTQVDESWSGAFEPSDRLEAKILAKDAHSALTDYLTSLYSPASVQQAPPILTWEERLDLCPTSDEMTSAMEAEIADWRAHFAAAPAQPAVQVQQAAPSSLSNFEIDILRRLIKCAETLNKRPRPMCRDCADGDGICATTGLECDMRRLFADAKALHNKLASSAAPVQPVGLSVSTINDLARAHGHCEESQPDQRGHAYINFTVQGLHKFAAAILAAKAGAA